MVHDVAVVSVVLADDSEAYRRGMRRAVEADPRLALLAEAADGLGAHTAILEHRPDVALLDLQMPGRDALEICRRLRAEAPEQLPRIVLVSAFLSPEVVQRAHALGIDDCLDKTISRRRICDLLANADPGAAPTPNPATWGGRRA